MNLNTRDLLLGSLASIYGTVKNSFEVFVVDNASSDGSADAVRSAYPEVQVIENSLNIGFARANNQALRRMRGRYACLLNSDAELTEGALDLMVSFMDSNSDVAVCGGQLLNADSSHQNSIANTPTLLTELTNKSALRMLMPTRFPGKEASFSDPVEVESIIGALMLVRHEAMEKTGLLDEDFFFFLEETDWCLRFKRSGSRIMHHPHARIFHFQGASAGKRFVRARLEYWRSRYVFFRKHYSRSTWALLLAGLLLRILVNLTAYLIYVPLTLFLLPKAVQRLRLYATLLLWHLLGLPAGWGLAPADTSAMDRTDRDV
ncbi:MAG: glycosyltransferase family 2 protein [Thermodesulfovibrionales bacterium]|nr:glycosyltransferase family 2 protein [Thermodesulfovibrionales bacterium]